MDFDRYDAIGVRVRDADFVVSYMEANANMGYPSALCNGEELLSVVERYLLRLLLHSP
jgi:hypothetical protein